jgi:HEPN domain-containing protein
MKETTREWVKKADADFHSAEFELDITGRRSNFDLICFLEQQCVEKFLKAHLQEQGLNVPRIHDLPALLDLLLPYEPLWESWRASFNSIKEFAVEFRYPGEDAEPQDAMFAYRVAKAFRKEALDSLGLPSD